MGREPRGGYDDYDDRGSYDQSSPASSRDQRGGNGRVAPQGAAKTPPSRGTIGNPNSRFGSSDPRPNGRGGSGPRGAREEDARRRTSRQSDPASDEAPQPQGRDGRGRRTFSRLARDLSQAMSRQLGAMVHGTERAVRRMAEPRPASRLAFAGSYPADLPSELLPVRYRRSRTRLKARKWRIQRTPPNPLKYFIILGSIAMAVLVVVGAGGAGLIYSINYYNAHLTQIQALAANLQNSGNTTIYDRNGQILYQVRDVNSNYNIYAPLAQISPLLQKATIDTEDPTFYSRLNIGIDFKSLLRAGSADVSSGRAAQGGSTITQQLVKNIVLADQNKTILRKVNEAILAVGVTLNYTKAQILEMYLNSIDYGNNNQGIEAAARNYYGLTPINHTNGQATTMANQQLSLAQIAILAGLPNNPTIYNPVVFSCASACPYSKWDDPCTNTMTPDMDPTTCDYKPTGSGSGYYCASVYACGTNDGHEWLVYWRAWLILGDMAKYGDITQAQEDNARQQVLTILEKHQIFQAAGTANGNVVQTNKNAPHFVDWLLKDVLPNDFGIDPTSLSHAGLKIYTTLDLNLDNYAQNRLNYYINGDPKQGGQFVNYWYCGGNIPPAGGCLQPGLAAQNVHNGSVVAIDPHTGDILTMVGSVNYGSIDKQVQGFNNIAISPYRSMGSSTKPLVYSTAFQMGWTPGTMLDDAPVCYPVPATDPTTNKPVVTDSYAPGCKGWYSPQNYEQWSFAGKAPVRTMLANSLNIPATEAMSFVGDGAADTTSDAFLAMARRLGVTTLQKGQMGPATALGAQDIPLLQLTGAYATFADAGVRHPYRAILQIQNSNGDVLYHAPPASPGVQVISPQAAYMITSILTDNKARLPDFGWYNPLYFDNWDPGVPEYPGIQIAAKTGTSQGPLDIVTMGYSPYLALGVWFGNTDGNDPLAPHIIGIAGAGYVFHDIMVWAIKNYHWPTGQNGTQPFQFPIPPGMALGQFNCDTGLAPYKGQKPQDCQTKPAVPPPPGFGFDIYAGLCPYPAGYKGCNTYPDIDWYDVGDAPLQS
jgi:peptidoglycan glycosyltransferase